MKQEKVEDLYAESFELISQIGSVIELVLEDLIRTEISNDKTRRTIDRCYAALTMLPDKIRQLELISDKRSLTENSQH